ncbi:hypothetical protein [Alloactinosynnema sp. L-07]|nr:hypothetical protein [Alloactinosynnema sp. L-07]
MRRTPWRAFGTFLQVKVPRPVRHLCRSNFPVSVGWAGGSAPPPCERVGSAPSCCAACGLDLRAIAAVRSAGAWWCGRGVDGRVEADGHRVFLRTGVALRVAVGGRGVVLVAAGWCGARGSRCPRPRTCGRGASRRGGGGW